MALDASIAHCEHDHAHCIESALQTANTLCQAKGVRLTPLREQVLKLIWQSHKPLGAYELMDMLANSTERRVAPPTVYRALEFLLEQHLIHRINTLNAYIGCTHPNSEHANNFLICEDCGVAIEFSSDPLMEAINCAAQHFDFQSRSQSLEIVGCCSQCLEAKS